MTFSTSIETAWNTSIWTNATILAVTDKIYKFTATQQSEFEATRFYYNGKVNFIEALTTRSLLQEETANVLGGVATYGFEVEVSYYKETDPDGTSYTSVRDFFEILTDYVTSTLGQTWGATVDYWRPQAEPPSIIEVLIDNNRRCWRGVYTYVGTKTASL